MEIIRLTRPRFTLANRAAAAVLRELNDPPPPIPLHEFIKRRGWEIIFSELYGPDGGMVKITYKNRSKYYIFLATDIKIGTSSVASDEIIKRRQLYTLAHELGHILLHGSFLANSHEFADLAPQTASYMEIEANWFASRLLMPNYIFTNITDLVPQYLADKCGVNLTPAQKRLKTLDPNIRNSLVLSAGFKRKVPLTTRLLYICEKCSHIYTEKTIWEPLCAKCNGKLVDASSLVSTISEQIS